MNSDLASMKNAQERQLAFWNIILLKRNTLTQGQIIDGYIMIDPESRYMEKVLIAVPFGKTYHCFEFLDKE